MTLSLRYAARSDVGLIREGNEDSGYAGPTLLAVADGMGGHAAGEVASSVTVRTLAELGDDVDASDLLEVLAAAVNDANDAISTMVREQPALDGMGTTLTALLWSGRRLGLVHVGDSRAYLLREGAFEQITHDHTFVQQLQDEGRITADEASVHPQRSLLLRALDGRNNPEPDLSVREVRAGDRYLVCSDGLSGAVSEQQLSDALGEPDLQTAVDALVELALRAGGPDNITCVVADIIDEDDVDAAVPPMLVGAAAEPRGDQPSDSTADLAAAGAEGEGPDRTGPGRLRGGWWVRGLILLVVAGVALGGWAGYSWSQRQYYVGSDAERVAIFKGLPQSVAGASLSERYERQDIPLTDLPPFEARAVHDTISAEDLPDARKIVDRLRESAARCRAARAAVAEPPKRRPRPAASSPATATSPTPSAAAAEPPTPTGSARGADSPSARASGSPSPSAAPSATPGPPTGASRVAAACREGAAQP